MSPTTLPTAKRAGEIDGRQVLFVVLGFFGIVFAVNGVLLYQALRTHSGLVAQEPYRKGLQYNSRIAASDRQAALGWTSEVVVPSDGRVTVALSDGGGNRITGLAVTGRLGRPSSDREDIKLAFTEQGRGLYQAAAGLVAPGTWQIDIEVRDPVLAERGGSEPLYRERRRLWLKP